MSVTPTIRARLSTGFRRPPHLACVWSGAGRWCRRQQRVCAGDGGEERDRKSCGDAGAHSWLGCCRALPLRQAPAWACMPLGCRCGVRQGRHAGGKHAHTRTASLEALRVLPHQVARQEAAMRPATHRGARAVRQACVRAGGAPDGRRVAAAAAGVCVCVCASAHVCSPRSQTQQTHTHTHTHSHLLRQRRPVQPCSLPRRARQCAPAGSARPPRQNLGRRPGGGGGQANRGGGGGGARADRCAHVVHDPAPSTITHTHTHTHTLSLSLSLSLSLCSPREPL
jgi:hypothetical protein